MNVARQDHGCFCSLFQQCTHPLVASLENIYSATQPRWRPLGVHCFPLHLLITLSAPSGCLWFVVHVAVLLGEYTDETFSHLCFVWCFVLLLVLHGVSTVQFPALCPLPGHYFSRYLAIQKVNFYPASGRRGTVRAQVQVGSIC